MDDPLGRALGGLRDARDEWVADSVPSAVQRSELPQWRDLGQVLSLPRGDRSKVLAYRNQGVPCSAPSRVDRGGGPLISWIHSAADVVPGRTALELCSRRRLERWLC